MPGNIVTVVGIVRASRIAQDRGRKGLSNALLNIYLQALSITSVGPSYYICQIYKSFDV